MSQVFAHGIESLVDALFGLSEALINALFGLSKALVDALFGLSEALVEICLGRQLDEFVSEAGGGGSGSFLGDAGVQEGALDNLLEVSGGHHWDPSFV